MEQTTTIVGRSGYNIGDYTAATESFQNKMLSNVIYLHNLNGFVSFVDRLLPPLHFSSLFLCQKTKSTALNVEKTLIILTNN